MPLTDREIAIIRLSFQRLKAEKGDANPFGPAFYTRVFEKMPEAREMFRDDMANQGMQFLSTLRVVVDHIDDLDRIDGELRNLGRGHGAYGVRAEQYGPMGDALIETMRDTLGPEFDAEAQAAWRKAYEAVASRMQAAVA